MNQIFEKRQFKQFKTKTGKIISRQEIINARAEWLDKIQKQGYKTGTVLISNRRLKSGSLSYFAENNNKIKLSARIANTEKENQTGFFIEYAGFRPEFL